MATKRNKNINPNLVGNVVPKGGYTEKYTGGNASLDEGLSFWSNQYNKAKAEGDALGMQNANDNANMLRNQHGYAAEYATKDIQSVANANPDKNRGGLGSSSGSGGSSGGFSYGSAPSYASKYSQDIAELSQLILNREPFSYDPETDDTYLQYQKSYTQAGQRAMDDTLGQISARTGGYASSYAGAAAQQAYNTYMSALADKIPELEQLAYSMYQDELASQRADLSMLMALEEGDYARYQDLLNQYNANRNFAYNAFLDDRDYRYQLGRDTVLDQRYDTEWQYALDREEREWQHALDREAIEDERYEDEMEYERQQAALDRSWQEDQAEFQNAMTRWALLGTADAEVSRVLGVPVGTRTTDWQYQQAQMRVMGL